MWLTIGSLYYDDDELAFEFKTHKIHTNLNTNTKRYVHNISYNNILF